MFCIFLQELADCYYILFYFFSMTDQIACLLVRKSRILEKYQLKNDTKWVNLREVKFVPQLPVMAGLIFRVITRVITNPGI